MINASIAFNQMFGFKLMLANLKWIGKNSRNVAFHVIKLMKYDALNGIKCDEKWWNIMHKMVLDVMKNW